MFKKVITTILIAFCMPVFAGELENALANNKNVMIYFYTPQCGSCRIFSPEFDKITQKYNKQFKFIKIDITNPYGHSLFHKYSGRYIPYIVITDSKNNVSTVEAECLMNAVCTNYTLSRFK